MSNLLYSLCSVQATPQRASPRGGSPDFLDTAARVDTVSAVYEWVLGGAPLDRGETNADRLLALMVGIVDADKDGQLNDAEEAVLDAVLDDAAAFLATKGIPEHIIDGVLSDWSADMADQLRLYLVGKITEEQFETDVEAFALNWAKNPTLDAVYKNKNVIRNGRKERRRQRVSGTIRLTDAQKRAIRKAQAKAHSGAAKIRRQRSMKMRAATLGG